MAVVTNLHEFTLVVSRMHLRLESEVKLEDMKKKRNSFEMCLDAYKVAGQRVLCDSIDEPSSRFTID